MSHGFAPIPCMQKKKSSTSHPCFAISHALSCSLPPARRPLLHICSEPHSISHVPDPIESITIKRQHRRNREHSKLQERKHHLVDKAGREKATRGRRVGKNEKKEQRRVFRSEERRAKRARVCARASGGPLAASHGGETGAGSFRVHVVISLSLARALACSRARTTRRVRGNESERSRRRERRQGRPGAAAACGSVQREEARPSPAVGKEKRGKIRTKKKRTQRVDSWMGDEKKVRRCNRAQTARQTSLSSEEASSSTKKKKTRVAKSTRTAMCRHNCSGERIVDIEEQREDQKPVKERERPGEGGKGGFRGAERRLGDSTRLTSDGIEGRSDVSRLPVEAQSNAGLDARVERVSTGRGTVRGKRTARGKECQR